MKALRFACFLLKTGMGNIIHCAPTLVPILAVRVPALVFARSCHPYCSYRPYHPCLAALHPVLHKLFAEYTDELGEYTGWGGGADSRWQIFQRGLRLLTRDQQVRILLEMCEYEGYVKHGRPSDEDISTLRALLLDHSAPGSDAAAARRRL